MTGLQVTLILIGSSLLVVAIVLFILGLGKNETHKIKILKMEFEGKNASMLIMFFGIILILSAAATKHSPLVSIVSNIDTRPKANDTTATHTQAKPKVTEKARQQSNLTLNASPKVLQEATEKYGKIKIAILPFEMVSSDGDYQWLSKGIPETLLKALSEKENYVVLEGVLREKVLKEIDFQQGKYVDVTTAVKFGRLIGANQIIIGSYQIFGSDIQITARVVNVESGRIEKNSIVEFKGTILNPFEMENEFARKMIERFK